MLRDQLHRQGIQVGRKQITTLMLRMGIAALLALESAALERKVGVVAPGGSGGTGQISGAGQILVKTAEGELKRQYAIPPNITVPAGAVISLVLNDNVEVPAGLAR